VKAESGVEQAHIQLCTPWIQCGVSQSVFRYMNGGAMLSCHIASFAVAALACVQRASACIHDACSHALQKGARGDDSSEAAEAEMFAL
jgi:hypothetical protein